MTFLIADTFTDSLARLRGEEQKAAKTTAFDLQMNPASPGLSFHKLDRAKDKNFWSVRVSADIRMIVHKTSESILLCYIDHHDKAYYWAERRKLEIHPSTGAAQLVEIRETVKEIVVPLYIQKETPVPQKDKKPVVQGISDQELLSYGIPPEWLPDVKAADEDKLLALIGHLPAEAGEALLELATGGKPRTQPVSKPDTDPFAHPDAQRRFRIMSDLDELKKALEYPWDKWTVFLHPDQRQLVEKDYNGPAKVSGSAGTGKTIVALHRAAHLARKYPDARVLLTTLNVSLANALKNRINRLVYHEPRLAERIDVISLDEVCQRLHKAVIGPVKIITNDQIRKSFKEIISKEESASFQEAFLWSEWYNIIDAWQIRSWEQYRDIVRLGRKKKLAEAQRVQIWSVMEKMILLLKEKGQTSQSGAFHAVAVALDKKPNNYDYVVVDEAQDLSVAQVRFLAALGSGQDNALFFAGDLGQRIFQQPFSWKSFGIDLRGRSKSLKVNYRTSHQIRQQADKLLGTELTDMDGNTEDRNHTVSVFNGPKPEIFAFNNQDEECEAVVKWVSTLLQQGVQPSEIGIFVRSENELPRAKAILKEINIPWILLDESTSFADGRLYLSTMHHAKGLEFKAVVVMACDDEIIPLQSRIESVTDQSDLDEVYHTERHLLYVACTRARDHLLMTAVTPTSEFMADMLE